MPHTEGAGGFLTCRLLQAPSHDPHRLRVLVVVSADMQLHVIVAIL